jgi:hypothetical protein
LLSLSLSLSPRGPNQSGPRWRFRVRADGKLVVDELMGVIAELGMYVCL